MVRKVIAGSPPPPRMMRRALLLILSLIGVPGCGTEWRTVPVAPQAEIPANRVFEVWRGSWSARWHAVRITADSISGVGLGESTDCEGCRAAVPRGEVDSLRRADDGDAGTILVVGTTLAVAFIAAAAAFIRGMRE